MGLVLAPQNRAPFVHGDVDHSSAHARVRSDPGRQGARKRPPNDEPIAHARFARRSVRGRHVEPRSHEASSRRTRIGDAETERQTRAHGVRQRTFRKWIPGPPLKNHGPSNSRWCRASAVSGRAPPRRASQRQWPWIRAAGRSDHVVSHDGLVDRFPTTEASHIHLILLNLPPSVDVFVGGSFWNITPRRA